MADFDYLVESPDLNQRFLIGSNTPKVNAFCPIDRTQLVWFNEYDFSHYSCMACHGTYHDKSPEALKQSAENYVHELKQRAEKQRKELSELEKILKVAEKNNIS